MKLLLTALAVVLTFLLLSIYFNQQVERIVPCTTDSDCHEKNPGLCREDQPYCL